MSYELLAIGAAMALIYAAISTYVSASLRRKMDEQAVLEKEWRKEHYSVIQCERESVAHWKAEAELREATIVKLQKQIDATADLAKRQAKDVKELSEDNDRLIDLNRELDNANKLLLCRIAAANNATVRVRDALAGKKELYQETQEELSCSASG